jgi:aminopeptidase
LGLSELYAAASLAATRFMGVKSGENVLVVSERGTSMMIAEAVAGACTHLGADVSIASFHARIPGNRNKMNLAGQYQISINQSFGSDPPPKPLVDAMSSSDVVFFSSAVTYPAKVIEETLKKGTRILAAFQMSELAFTRTLLVDHEVMAKRAEHLARALSGDTQVTVTSKAGTKLAFEHMTQRDLVYEKYLGICREPGKMGQLPPGMIATSPREGSGNGVVVVDGAVFGVPRPLDEPLRLEVSNHRIVGVKGGGSIGRAFADELDANDSNSRTFPSEWGIGLNPGSCLGPDIEGETCFGTVHFGVGRNAHVAGGLVKSNFHADFVIKAPTVTANDKVLLQSGVFVV